MMDIVAISPILDSTLLLLVLYVISGWLPTHMPALGLALVTFSTRVKHAIRLSFGRQHRKSVSTQYIRTSQPWHLSLNDTREPEATIPQTLYLVELIWPKRRQRTSPSTRLLCLAPFVSSMPSMSSTSMSAVILSSCLSQPRTRRTP